MLRSLIWAVFMAWNICHNKKLKNLTGLDFKAWKDSTKIFHVEFYGVNVEAESRSEKGRKNFVERQLFGLFFVRAQQIARYSTIKVAVWRQILAFTLTQLMFRLCRLIMIFYEPHISRIFPMSTLLFWFSFRQFLKEVLRSLI